MLIFNKNIQLKVATYPERAHTGTAPTLQMVRQTYSHEVLIAWIMAQLEDLNDYSGTQGKISIQQMEEIANIISTEYHYLKVTELHLFLYKLKAGYYGVFYGNVDPLTIMSHLIKFNDERKSVIAAIERRIQQQKQDEQRAQWAQTAISRQKYEQLKKRKV